MKQGTELVWLGRDLEPETGLVNMPIYRGSTVLSPNMAAWQEKKQQHADGVLGVSTYGRFGTPAHHALQGAIAKLEGGHASLVYPSGLAAITSVLLAFLAAGDHVLISDSAYGPTTQFIEKTLSKFGVTMTAYAPTSSVAEIETLFTPQTKVLFVESPGSDTLEIQDIPALAQAAKARGVTVIMDNTWATPLFFKPFEHGVDVSIQAATKYITGHSDCLLGVATANEQAWPTLLATTRDLGQTAGPDEVFLALRGLRTMGVRLKQHFSAALHVAQWLESRPEVEAVFHPGLVSHPGHAIWKRDYTGACGLFSFALKPISEQALAAFIDQLKLFGLGLSWGGFESLAIPIQPARKVASWPHEGPGVRIHIGLEDVEDLINDLNQAFEYMHQVESQMQGQRKTA